MKRLLLVGVGLLLLAGCAPTATTPAEDTNASGADGCLTVSTDAVAALQEGIDEKQPGYTLGATAAMVDREGWFVSGIFTGPGIEAGQSAVWYTVTDPTAPGDNAYISIDAFAREFSKYLQPSWADATLDEADAVRACLS